MSEETPTYGAANGGPSARERALRLADACERNASDYGQQWEGHAAEMVAALALGNLAIADELAGISSELQRLRIGARLTEAQGIVRGRDAELARLAIAMCDTWAQKGGRATTFADMDKACAMIRAHLDARDRRDDGEAARDADGSDAARYRAFFCEIRDIVKNDPDYDKVVYAVMDFERDAATRARGGGDG